MKDDVGKMSWDTYKEIFKQYVPYAIKLNWRGEPFLHSGIVDMICYAKKMGVLDVSLNTNGLLLNKSLVFNLACSGLNWIIFSVDGATANTYEKIRIGGDFETLIKNIIMTKIMFGRMPQSPRIRIQICKQPENQHEIDLWHEMFSIYADKMRVGHLFDPQGKNGLDIIGIQTCTQPWQRLTIDWQGNIYPCCSDFLGMEKLGNVHQEGIYRAWHSVRETLLRERLVKYGRKGSRLCRNCSSYC